MEPGRKKDKIDQYIRDLASHDPNLRKRATRMLGQMHGLDKDDVEESFSWVLKNADKEGAVQAVAALKQINFPNYELAPLLLQALNDTDKEVRVNVVAALGQVRNIDELVQALNDAEKEVRVQAAATLGQVAIIYMDVTVESLIQATNDTEKEVRDSAATSLEYIVRDCLLNEAIKREYGSFGVVSADDRVEAKRERKELIARLVKICNFAKEAKTSELAIEMLVRAWNEPENLITEIADEEIDIEKDVDISILRYTVGDVLGLIGEVDPLIQASGDADRFVRRSAIQGLIISGDPKTEAVFVKALNDDDPPVRCYAVEGLSKIGSPGVVELLTQVLGDTSSDVRRDVVLGLERIGNEQVIEPLIRALIDTDTKVRVAAVVALGNIGGDRAVKALAGMLRDVNSG